MLTGVQPQYRSSAASYSGRTGWQTEAWEFMDLVAELRYYVGWLAGACARAPFIASELDDRGKPTGRCSNRRVNEIAQSVGGSYIGANQFIHRSVECLAVPGETFQSVIFPPGNDYPNGRWLALSRDEIRKQGAKTIIEVPEEGAPPYELTGDDSLWRVWKAHPRRAKQPDSAVRASLDPLREIARTTKTIANASNSRLIGAGVVFVPQEMSLPMSLGPTAADKPVGAPGVVELRGTPAVQELSNLLYAAAAAAYDDPESHAALIPLFASVPGEMIAKISHLKFDNDVTEVALKTRNDAIARLAMGLNVSPERLLGLGSSTNHWSAWQIGDNDVQLHIEPMMDLMCEALNAKVFRKLLVAEGFDPEKYVLWYDTSQLTGDPDKTDDAQNAFDRGVITAEAYREYLGLGATGYDLSTLDGWRKWAQDAVSKDPNLFLQFLPLLDSSIQSIDFPQPAIAGGSSAAPGEADPTNEGNDPQTEGEDPGYDQGKRGRKEDVGSRVVSDHAGAFVRVFVTRALELAGKRRRSYDPASKARLRGLKPHEFHLVMEPVDAAEIPKLVTGWDDALEDDVLAMIGTDRDEFRSQVMREVRRQLTATVVDGG